MEDWLSIGVLYAAGLLLLLGDFFLPSHGILTLASLGLLGFALYRTFCISEQAGVVALVLLVVSIPSMLAVAVKYWHRTWMGRRISPPNPVLTEADRLPVQELKAFIGRSGRSLTPLRPVGMCLFDDRRIECVAEGAMIGAGVEVEGARLADRTLVVRPVVKTEAV